MKVLNLNLKPNQLQYCNISCIILTCLGLGFCFSCNLSILKLIKQQCVTTSACHHQTGETALKGTLKKTTSVPIRFFLLTSSDEAVTLQAPDYITLDKLIGRRILATGNYSQKQKLLIIQDVQDLEVLPTTP
jgi:hypothetical protein